jgi:hypothetical protein
MTLEAGLTCGFWTLQWPDSKRPYHWKCRCECGTKRSVRDATLKSGLKSGKPISCGCAHSLALSNRKIHGKTNDPEYRAWQDMKSRCLNPKHRSYKRYGGRGITVCERWLTSFENFLEDVGERPAGKRISLGRIKNDKGYGPDNVEWQTDKQQYGNRGNCVLITSSKFGTKPQAEWADIFSERTGNNWTPGRLNSKLKDKLVTIDVLLTGLGITDLSADYAHDTAARELIAA